MCGVDFKDVEVKALADGVKQRANEQVVVKADEVILPLNDNDVLLR